MARRQESRGGENWSINKIMKSLSGSILYSSYINPLAFWDVLTNQNWSTILKIQPVFLRLPWLRLPFWGSYPNLTNFITWLRKRLHQAACIMVGFAFVWLISFIVGWSMVILKVQCRVGWVNKDSLKYSWKLSHSLILRGHRRWNDIWKMHFSLLPTKLLWTKMCMWILKVKHTAAII